MKNNKYEVFKIFQVFFFQICRKFEILLLCVGFFGIFFFKFLKNFSRAGSSHLKISKTTKKNRLNFSRLVFRVRSDAKILQKKSKIKECFFSAEIFFRFKVNYSIESTKAGLSNTNVRLQFHVTSLILNPREICVDLKIVSTQFFVNVVDTKRL